MDPTATIIFAIVILVTAVLALAVGSSRRGDQTRD